jgi:hypothetical protein
VTRTIRERPRFAAFLGLGVVCLVGLGLLGGVLLGGTEESSGAGERERALQVRQAQELRAARSELDAARGEIARLDRLGDRRDARVRALRRRTQRLERRNAALQRALAQARAE